MLHIFNFLQTTMSFIIIISILVFIHEFGHYIIAKLAGVRIEIFSIGFGRELFGITDKSGTRWKISALPLGGYVKMFGDASEVSNPTEEIDKLPEEDKKYTFYHKSLIRKAAIVVAGPLANFILTIFIFTIFINIGGLPSVEPVVGEVIKDSPAQLAGLLPGDRILSIDDEGVESFNDIPRLILTNINTPVLLKISRADKELLVTIIPRQVTDKDNLGNDFTHPVIGIKSQNIKMKDVGLPRSVWEATLRTYHFCTLNLRAIGQIIAGKRKFTESITGPIGMAKMSGQAAEKGAATFFMLMATISASLGMVNLFPIPMLDGGHLLYYAIEAIRGRPMARKFQEYGLRVGMALIAMLMASAILNDIYKWLVTFSR